jgi:calcineurin-like phosphoesterase family protein
MTRYFVSDLHLGHENIIEYCDRPYESVTEMNDTLVGNWNRVIDPNDVVFFLGDLGHFAEEEELRRWLEELHGRVVFIEGNHDSPDRYVDGVHTHQYYILSRGDRQFCCTHRPENAPEFWDGWIIHGHHHNSHPADYPLVNPEAQTANVSIELTDYEPLPEHELIELIDSGEWIPAVHKR